METILDQKIERLPKWAQKLIADTQRERDVAQRQLSEYEDNQTESGIYYEEYVCDGRSGSRPSYSIKYINGTNKVSFEHCGVKLMVTLTENGGVSRNGIELRWHKSGRLMKEISMIPVAHQTVRLVTTENMDT